MSLHRQRRPTGCYLGVVDSRFLLLLHCCIDCRGMSPSSLIDIWSVQLKLSPPSLHHLCQQQAVSTTGRLSHQGPYMDGSWASLLAHSITLAGYSTLPRSSTSCLNSAYRCTFCIIQIMWCRRGICLSALCASFGSVSLRPYSSTNIYLIFNNSDFSLF